MKNYRKEFCPFKGINAVFFAVATLFFVACDNQNPDATIRITPASITASADGGTYTVQVSSTGAWNASFKESWVTITPKSGKGDAEVSIEVAPTKQKEASTCIVTFTTGEKKAGLTVYREGQPETDPSKISVTPATLTAPVSGGTFSAQLKSNGRWIAAADQPWIEVSPTSGDGDADITVNIGPSSDGAQAKGLITFTNDDYIKAYLNVTREAVTGNTLTVNPSKLDFPIEGGEVAIQVTSNGSWTANTNGSSWFSLDVSSGENNSTVKVLAFAATTYEKVEGTLTFTQTDGLGNVIKQEIPVSLAGLIHPYFSVSSSKKVVFATGNVMYNVGSKTWKFAEHQWEYVGEGNAQIGSSTYTGWMDLFGWGTGNNPTYLATGYNDYPTFNDWGVHFGKAWRTPSRDEWDYILHNRSNAKNLYSWSCVNGVHGYIFIPDNGYFPKGMKFTPHYESTPSVNNYTAAEWNILEKYYGLLFLPSTGTRSFDYSSGEIHYNEGNACYYWSSTPYVWPDDPTFYRDAYYFGGYLYPKVDKIDRRGGHSVRLIKDAP